LPARQAQFQDQPGAHCTEPMDHQERTLCVGTTPPPPAIVAPLFGPPWIVDTAHPVVTVAVATMIAMVMIFRISFSIPEMSRSAFPDSGKVD